MEPVTTVTTVLTIAKSAGEVSKKLYELAKGIKDRDLKQQIDEILDKMRELKHAASALEDENRELREKLRFKSNDYEFRLPFWYEKAKPEQALCPKCYSKGNASPMREQGQECDPRFRRCLVCDCFVQVDFSRDDNEVLSSGETRIAGSY